MGRKIYTVLEVPGSKRLTDRKCTHALIGRIDSGKTSAPGTNKGDGSSEYEVLYWATSYDKANTKKNSFQDTYHGLKVVETKII